MSLMMLRHLPLYCTLLLVCAPAFGAQDDEVETLAADVAAQLEVVLSSGGGDAEGVLASDCIAVHADIDLLLDVLEGIIDDDQTPQPRLRAAQWTLADVLHRYGDMKWADEILDELVESDEPRIEWLVRKAQLQDAQGKTEDAVERYNAILELSPAKEVEDAVQLRIAMIELAKDEESAGSLAEYARAEGRTVELRNRAAVVLALLGRPQEAIDLFQTGGEGTKLFRSEVRVAEWAIRAEDAAKAQEYALLAMNNATLKRDRHYALAVLVESHRMDDTLDTLIDRFAATKDLSPAARNAWIDLLRERGRIDEAVTLFQEAKEGEFSVEMRSELLEMYREAGREDTMVDVYRGLIEQEPVVLAWREGLSRFYLERGDPDAAKQVWASFIGAGSGSELLWGAETLMSLGLDKLAIEAAEASIASSADASPVLLFLFALHRERGNLPGAEAALERLDGLANADSASRMQLAEGFEQLGNLERAVTILEDVRSARAEGEVGEDLEMRLCWLYSEIDEEEKAMTAWLGLWRKINSVPRRRYVEDRLMTVAARLGQLADVAIELEEKLESGQADSRDSGLLVRLYTKVGDPVSAAEVIEEFMKQSGGNVVDALQEKARVFVSCTDYHNYEKVVRELIVLDPEGLGDYLRQLAMSQLERGRPDEAAEILSELKDLEGGSDSFEFEAGVLALAGMRDEAVQAYRRGLSKNPARIDSYLLMANLMKDSGARDRAIGMFQYLAENAKKDDLFTIAIDGLLNMEAEAPIIRWARRITLERLAGKHDKMYLYQLLSDLSEEVEAREDMLTSLENSLPISGERRPSILRELMDLARGQGDTFTGRGWKGDSDKHLAYGRRLIGLSELVPPQVYLDLGEAFLKNDDVADAAKTFRLAHDLPEYGAFQRQAADLFESASYHGESLRTYERVLVTHPSDVGLMSKVAELQEQMGHDDIALGLYERSLELLLVRRPFSTFKAAKASRSDDPFAWYSARNIDDYDQYYQRVLKGLLVTAGPEEAVGVIERQRMLIAGDLAAVQAELADRAAEPTPEEPSDEEASKQQLRRFPRLLRRSEYFRRITITYRMPELANELDLSLLATFPDDETLLEEMCRTRVGWGLVASARDLIDGCGRSDEEKRKVRFLVGEGVDEGGGRLVPLAEAKGLFLPLLANNKVEEAKTMLRRTSFGDVAREDVGQMQALFSAALYLDDPDLTLLLGRQWVRMLVKNGTQEYELQPVLERCRVTLDEARAYGLYQYLIGLIFEDPEKHSGLITMLPKLQTAFDEPLVTEDQVLELLDGYGERYAWGLGPVLQLLPSAARASALRGIWPKVQNTVKTTFLMQLVGQFKEPLGEELAEFIMGSFEETLEDGSDTVRYYIDDLYELEHNFEVGLAISIILQEELPSSWAAKTLEAVMLKELGRNEEAVEKAMVVFSGLISNTDTDYYIRRAYDHVNEEFQEEHLDAFIAKAGELRDASPDDIDLELKRLDLIEKKEDEELSFAELELAIERHPEEKKLLQRLRNRYSRDGRRMESIAVLEQILELDPEEPQPRRQLMNTWRSLRNYERALEVREAGPIQEEEKEEGVSMEAGMSMIMVAGGGTIYINSAGAMIQPQAANSGGDWPEGKTRPANIKRVKESLEEGEIEEARTTLRRIWRQYPKNNNNRMAFFTSRYNRHAALKWPKDPEEKTPEGEETEEEKKPHRGGLESWTDEEPEPREERDGAWHILAEHDFGVQEMERLLRTANAGSLDSMQTICEGLLRARTLEIGEEAALEELRERVASGRAGKIDNLLFLALLDENPDALTADVRELLHDLVQTLDALDITQLRRLARAYARAGANEEATRLYRWCATQTQSPSRFFGSSGSVSAHDLVKEVKETLEGDDRREIIEAILKFADPGDDTWSREGYESLAIDTWEELAGIETAMDKCADICTEATDYSTGLRRGTAKKATYLYARSGNIERAVECLEASLCKLDPSLFTYDDPFMYIRPEQPGFWGYADIRKLFPKDSSEWPDAAGWYAAAAQALEGWLDEERLRDSNTIEALVILSVRLTALGETAEAERIVQGLAQRDELSSSQKLWIIDAAREAGLADLADGMERKLFDDRRLHIERVPEVVKRLHETDGAEAALALGQTATEYTLHFDLLEELAVCAEELGQTDAATHWRERKAASEAAKARMEELDEEAKKAKLEKSAKKG